MIPGAREKLSVEVTTRCNSDCAYCFARAGHAGFSSLPLKIAKEILDDGRSAGYRHLHITGGEPLLWKGLFDIVDYSFELGYESVFLNTNGALLDKGACRRLAAFNDLSISVSLQGPQAQHDDARGPGSFAKAIRGLEIALAAGVDVYVYTTACKSLLEELPFFVDAIYKRFPAIKYLTVIQPMRVSDDNFDMSEELLEPSDFLRLVRVVALLNLYGLRIDVLGSPLACAAAKLMRMPWVPQTPPLQRPGRIHIMADPSMTLSHSSRDSFGLFEPGMIAGVLASGAYREATAPDRRTCPACDYTVLCSKNDLNRPSLGGWDLQPGEPYCKRVLAAAER